MHWCTLVVFDHQLAIGEKNKRMKKESMNHINDSRQILSFFLGWGWGVDCGVGEEEDIKKAYSNSTSC
jgi:hypothetical protein